MKELSINREEANTIVKPALIASGSGALKLTTAFAAVFLLGLIPEVLRGQDSPPPGSCVIWGGNPIVEQGLPGLLTNVLGIAAGNQHTVALRTSGEVVAWGDNYSGQTTVPLSAGSGVMAVAAGKDHTVALKTNGAVVAWGPYDQTTVPVSAQSGVMVIAAGGDHTVALKTNGAVVAWGDNSFGQTTVPLSAQSGVMAIAAGGNRGYGGEHTVALRTNGEVVAWGANGSGQTTVPVSAQSGVMAVAAGLFHTVVLKTNGAVVAWGDNTYGQAPTPIPVSAQSGVMAIAAGYSHTVALKTNGAVVAWGYNTYGQTTVPVSAQSGVMAIVAGRGHTVALKTNGAVVAWGDNTYGQAPTPIPVSAQSGVIAIAASPSHTVALKTSGEVVAWGYNTYGQTTVPVSAQSGVMAIAVGGDYAGGHTVALRTNGEVVAWGANGSGQTTVPVSAQSGVMAVAAGFFHTVVLKTNGAVVAWGDNTYGQAPTPIPVSAQSGVMAIAAGYSHTVALKTNGAVVAWGYNTYGQTTVPVSAQSGVMAIAAGNIHTVALKTSGEVVAWGANSIALTTVPVSAQSGVMAITAGDYHTVALKTDGTVVAWEVMELPDYGRTNVPLGLNVIAIAAGGFRTMALVLSDFPSGWRFNRGGLCTGDFGYSRGGHLFHYDDFGLNELADGIECAVFVASKAFNPTLVIYDAATGATVTQNANPAQESQILTFFTPTAGRDYGLVLSSFVGNQIGNYDLGVYPVVRPGSVVHAALSLSDTWMTNRVGSVGSGVWYKDDYLLQGVSANEQIRLSVENAEFDSFLEIRLLENESVEQATDEANYSLNVQGGPEGARNYLIRVTSSTNGGLGSYTLRVERSDPPQVWGFSPGSGIPGTRVRVWGTNFMEGLNPMVSDVKFGGVPGNIIVYPFSTGAAQELEAEVPSGGVSGPITVVRNENANSLGVSANSFVVLGPLGLVRREGVGGFSFGVSNAVSGATNVVEATTNLQAPVLWQRVATNVALNPSVWRYTNHSDGTYPERFFRVRVGN